MSTYEALKGMMVTMYMDGGWEVSGEISQVKDDSIFVKSNNSMYMIFKSKVSALLLNDEERKDNRSRPRYTEAVKTNAAKAPTASNFPMNSASYDESGMTLPENLLEAPLENSEDFSVFFRANPSGGVNNIGIEFGVEEDGTSEKD